MIVLRDVDRGSADEVEVQASIGASGRADEPVWIGPQEQPEAGTLAGIRGIVDAVRRVDLEGAFDHEPCVLEDQRARVVHSHVGQVYVIKPERPVCGRSHLPTLTYGPIGRADAGGVGMSLRVSVVSNNTDRCARELRLGR